MSGAWARKGHAEHRLPGGRCRLPFAREEKDISDRGPQDKETSGESYRLLVNAVTDYAIYMLDAQGYVVSWNPGAQRFKGYTAPEIVGRHFSRFYTEEDLRAGVPAHVLAVAAATGKFEAEGWRVRKDGSRFWAHVVIDAIRDPAGELIGYAKITRDLTERRLVELSLERSQEEFRLLVQSVTDYAIFMLDAAGNIASWNAGAQRIKGYAPEDVIGTHFSRFYTEEDRATGEPRRALATAIVDGRFEKEGWRVRRDGTRFWASVVIDPIYATDGGVRGFAKVTRDITERRDAQKKLEEAREALFQSQKMDAIGKLTGGVAHDFNNLLTVIIGSLELVRKGVPDEPRLQGLMSNALEAAQRGGVLTQRMLAFSRRQELAAEPTDVRALIIGMSDLLESALGGAIDITTQFPMALGTVMVDRNQLEMALLNLSVNARDAMPEGGPLTIAVRQDTLMPGNARGLRPGKYVGIQVIDKGQGMDETTRVRATEPFYTTKGVGKGTGLGLSMVQGLAEQLGGGLQIESRPGAGTTVSLWLPVVEGIAAGQAGAVEDVPDDLAPLDVLVVDDDALVLMSTAAMLEDRNHKATMAYSGGEALKMLRAHPYDLVITDQGMPGMSGTEFIERLRVEFPAMPVLLATAYAEVPEAAALKVARLSKPFLQADLLAAMARTLTVH